MTPDLVFTPVVLQPCVYIFWLGERCQYVGQSKLGIRRPFDTQHSVWAEKDFAFDKLEVFYTKADALDATEQRLIRTLSPRFNTAYHPVHKSGTAVKHLLVRCETAMIHEQDKLADAADQAKVQRIYEHAAREIIQFVNFR